MVALFGVEISAWLVVVLLVLTLGLAGALAAAARDMLAAAHHPIPDTHRTR